MFRPTAFRVVCSIGEHSRLTLSNRRLLLARATCIEFHSDAGHNPLHNNRNAQLMSKHDLPRAIALIFFGVTLIVVLGVYFPHKEPEAGETIYESNVKYYKMEAEGKKRRKEEESKQAQEKLARDLAESKRHKEATADSETTTITQSSPPTRTFNTWTPPTRARTLGEWTAIIQQDAKVSAIYTLLGKPDKIQSVQGCMMCVWASQMDDGTNNATALALQVKEVRGEMVIMGIYEPVNRVLIKFQWYQ